MKLPLTKTAFWDVELDKLDEQLHADFIIARVFQYGLTADLRLVIRNYTPEQIRAAIDHTRGMEKRGKALAEVFAKQN